VGSAGRTAEIGEGGSLMEKEPAGMPALGKTKRLKMECKMENVSSL